MLFFRQSKLFFLKPVLETRNDEVADDDDSGDDEGGDNHQDDYDTEIHVPQGPVSGKDDEEKLDNYNIMKQT